MNYFFTQTIGGKAIEEAWRVSLSARDQIWANKGEESSSSEEDAGMVEAEV